MSRDLPVVAEFNLNCGQWVMVAAAVTIGVGAMITGAVVQAQKANERARAFHEEVDRSVMFAVIKNTPADKYNQEQERFLWAGKHKLVVFQDEEQRTCVRATPVPNGKGGHGPVQPKIYCENNLD